MRRHRSLASLPSAVAFLLFLSSACDQSRSRGEDDVVKQAAIEELQGNWRSNCRDAQKFGLSERSSLRVSGTSALQVTEVSSSGNCGPTAVIVTQSARTSSQEEGQQARPIDITVESIKVRPVSEAGVATLSLAAFCGETHWRVGVDRDVTNEAGGENCFPKLPKTYFDLFAVVANRLYFGRGDNSSSERRPVLLDKSRWYERQ